MTYYIISSLVNGFTSLIIGLFILIKKRSRLNFSFIFFSFSVSLWSFSYFFWQLSENYNTALFLSKILTAFSVLIPISYFKFAVDFSKDKKIFIAKKILYIGYIIASFFLIITPSNLLVNGLESRMGFKYWPIAGNLYWAFLFMFFGLASLSIFLFYNVYKKESGIRKEQAKILLIGTGLGFLGGSTNFLLWYNLPVKPYGNILVSLYVIFTAYAIIKYRFADISLIIKRSSIFVVSVVIITSVYTLFAYLISVYFQGLIGTQSIILNGVITAILVSIGFEPLKKWLSLVTDKYLFKAPYDPEDLLAEFSDKLSSTLDLGNLTSFIAEKLSQVFKSNKAALFLLDKKTGEYTRRVLVGEESKTDIKKIDKKLFDKIFQYLKEIGLDKEIVVNDEIKKLNEQLGNPTLKLLIKELDKNQISLIVPLYLRDDLTGILFLGEKKSGDIYNTTDLRILEIIAKQSAVSIQNAELYQEQKNFAITLKQEVDRATKELKSANAQLRKLDQAKSEFISIASHQLRTPLTIIKGYISMIEQGDFGKVPEKIYDPLDKVYKSTMRIIALVEDLLNISRIESGRLKYEFEKSDLTKIAEEVFEELQQHAKNRGLKFTFEKPKEEIPEVIIDKAKIREVVMNLMDNAIKYTDKGFVKVIIKKIDNSVEFCVSDSGRGVAPDEMPMLFQKFSRTKEARLMHTEGTGLGLYIAKQIIGEHGGKIWAESDGLNKGSRFCLSLKIKNKKLEKELKKEK